MITVYGLPRSRSSRALWALEESGTDYEFVALDFAAGEQRKPEYLKLSPAAKVPTLVDDDLVLTESAAIVNYVCGRYGEDLLPSDPVARADYDRWSFFALSELEQPLWTIGKHKFALPSEHRVAEIFPTAQWEYQKALDLLSEGLGEKLFILGDAFSGADILLGHTLNWGVAFKQPLEQDSLRAYSERVNARPAFQRVLEREGR